MLEDKTIPVLETEGLTMRFGGLTALSRVNFRMDKGMLWFLIGPNGAGKTTFFNVVTGKLRPSEGKVRFMGEVITRMSIHEISRRGIGRTFQIPNLFGNLTVSSNIMIAAQKRTQSFNPFAGENRGIDRETTEMALKTVGLVEKRNTIAGSLSHGEKRKLELGIALALKPTLLLLDEPTAGLNDVETNEMAQLLKKISDEISLLVIEHDIEFMREIAEVITVFHKGSILAEGSLSEIEHDERVKRVYLEGVEG
jgi:urea ABC transporter ATP-binding protein UrtD